MVKELPRSQGGVTRLRKTHLHRFNLGMMGKVVRAGVASGRRRELARKNGRSGRRTKNSRGVGIGKIHATPSQLIDIRRDRSGCRFQTTNPVVHVIDSEEENVGAIFGDSLAENKEQQIK